VVPVEMIQFPLKLLLKQRILAVCHDFHWLLVATNFIHGMLRSGNFGKVGFYLRLRNPGGCHNGCHEKHVFQVQVKVMALLCQKKLLQSFVAIRNPEQQVRKN